MTSPHPPELEYIDVGPASAHRGRSASPSPDPVARAHPRTAH